MNSEIRALWTGALRSGDYVQGRGALRGADDKYCCLGVLCEVAVQVGAIDPAKLEAGREMYTYEAESGSLPTSVSRWAGFPEAYDERQTLIDMNDNERRPFVEIADWIDENL